MYPTMTPTEVTRDADNLFFWTAIVVLLIMGPLEVIIACTAINDDFFGKVFSPAPMPFARSHHRPVSDIRLVPAADASDIEQIVKDEHAVTVRL